MSVSAALTSLTVTRRSQCSEGSLAQGAVALLRLIEPLVQAGRVELVVARAALELGQRARGGVDDRVADRALLDALEDLG